MLMEANEYILGHQKKDDNTPSSDFLNDGDNSSETEKKNKDTLMLDATGVPSNIRYPQDILLLNETREKLETISDRFLLWLVIAKTL